MASEAPQANVSIESVLGVQQHTFLQRFTSSQAFWVTVALIIICIVMSWLQPESFATTENFYNTTRNFLLHRHHGARHDSGHRDGRHRSLGRLDHGSDRRLVRPRSRSWLSRPGPP